MDYSNYCVICAHMRSLLKENKLESVNSSIVSKPSSHGVIWGIWVWITESQCIDIAYFEDGRIMCTVLEANQKFDYFEDPNEVIKWIDEIVETAE